LHEREREREREREIEWERQREIEREKKRESVITLRVMTSVYEFLKRQNYVEQVLSSCGVFL
jgi:hypothetical protein